MHKIITITSLIFCISLLFSTGVFAAGSCSIESGPIPELAQYMRDVDTRISELTVLGRNSGKCGLGVGGASSSVERTGEVVDMAFLEVPIFGNLFLDFLYNIQIAANGETRTPVVRDGQIFNTVEQRLTSSITTVTNQCVLDGSVKSGFATLLQQNHTLENIYKQAALGTPTSNYFGLSSGSIIVAKAINIGYVPTMTESCKDQNGIEGSITKILKSIETIGAKNEGALSDWKKAITLFQGGGNKMTIVEYNAIQRKLLQNELSRQGFSSRMSSALLGNFDCVKAKSNGSDTAESQVQAQKICLVNPILGVENILFPWRQKVVVAKTTDERVYQVNELSREEEVKTSIVKMDNFIRAQNTPAIDTKSALMLDLIDLHISLLLTATSIEKRLPVMYANCMKGGIGISCPKP